MDDDLYNDALDEELYAPPTPSRRDERIANPEEGDAYLDDLEGTEIIEGEGYDPEQVLPPVPAKKAAGLFDLPEPIVQAILAELNPVDLLACRDSHSRLRRCLSVAKTDINAANCICPARSGTEIWQDSWDVAHACANSELPPLISTISPETMTELLTSEHCQQCHAVGPVQSRWVMMSPSRPWQDVRMIWQLGKRWCGNCFEANTVKDVEVLLTDFKFVTKLIPFVFRTPDKVYVSPGFKSSRGVIPANLPLQKVFDRGDLGKAKRNYDAAKAQPSAVFDGYINDTQAAAKRIEREGHLWVEWEMMLPLGTTVCSAARDLLTLRDRRDRSMMPKALLPLTQAEVDEHSKETLHSDTPRTLQPLATLNRNRSAEIERRAFEEFDPPILPTVLHRMLAYREAVYSRFDLSLAEWQELKPKLAQQRLAAEFSEMQHVGNLHSGRLVDDLRTSRSIGETSRDMTNRIISQKLTRMRMSEIADQVIAQRWDGGRKLFRGDLENFVADALLTTLDQYRLQTKSRSDDPDHIVTLDTMKYLFDLKVKPIAERFAERFGRELFVCSDCDDISKKYTFEGIIQHFGAKHEPDFGHDNVVVSWQTVRWPDDPPFLRHPIQSRRVPPVYALDAQRTIEHQPRLLLQAPPDRAAQPAGTANLDSLLRSLQIPSAESQRAPAPAGPVIDDHEATRRAAGVPTATEHTTAPVKTEHTTTPIKTEHTTAPPKTGPPSVPTPPAQSHPTSANAPQDVHRTENPWLNGRIKPPPSIVGSPQEREGIVKVAKETYKLTGAVPELQDEVRVHTILQEIGKRYLAQFGRPLDIDILIQTASSRPEFKPVKAISSLLCGACPAVDGAEHELVTRRYKLMDLLLHFKMAHTPVDGSTPADWLDKLIVLPPSYELRLISKLEGMTQEKMDVIARSLPREVFGDSPPRVSVPTDDAAPSGLSALTSALISYRPPPNNGDVASGAANGKRKRGLPLDDGDEGETSVTEAGEDQYDPRRPMIAPSSPRRTSGYRKPTGRDRRHNHREPHKKRRGQGFEDPYASGIPDVIRNEYIPDLHDREEGQISEDDDYDEVMEERSPPPSPLAENRVTLANNPGHRGRFRERSPPREAQQLFDQHGTPVRLSYVGRADAREQEPERLPRTYSEYRRKFGRRSPPARDRSSQDSPRTAQHHARLPQQGTYRQREATYTPPSPPSVLAPPAGPPGSLMPQQGIYRATYTPPSPRAALPPPAGPPSVLAPQPPPQAYLAGQQAAYAVPAHTPHLGAQVPTVPYPYYVHQPQMLAPNMVPPPPPPPPAQTLLQHHMVPQYSYQIVPPPAAVPRQPAPSHDWRANRNYDSDVS